MRLSYPSVVILSLYLQANELQATPCVGSDFATPLPGASNVTAHAVDVPSPLFPGFWQEGTKNGFDYVLYANGDATLQTNEEGSWRISVSCALDASECAIEVKGSPTEQAMQVAEQLKQCLQQGEVTEPSHQTEETPDVDRLTNGTTAPVQGVESNIDAGSSTRSLADDSLINQTEEKQACGAEAIDDDNATRKLQRMLILADADPGPVDGLPGSMTNSALLDVLGELALQLSTEEAVAAVQRLICPTIN